MRGAARRGFLTVGIVYEDERRVVDGHDAERFSVPSDYYAHNDAVEAAPLTLVERWYSVVTLDFPISTRCAELLTAQYALAEIGPVDATLPPREPGPWLGLGFSGGIDSTSLWLLLLAVLGREFRVISTAYGGRFAYEEVGFRQFAPDLGVVTNLRELLERAARRVVRRPSTRLT